MNKSTIKNNFSRNARFYDQHSNVQADCSEILLGLLDNTSFKSILEIGCGTGTYTARLFGRYPDAAITAVDISKPMLNIAEEKLKGTGVVFIEADGENLSLNRHFDLVTANASFQWFAGIDAAVRRFSDMLEDGGRICFSIYGPETFKEFRETLKEYLGRETRLSSSKFAEAESLKKELGRCFSDIELIERSYNREFPSLLDFLRDIKFSGTRGSGLESEVRLGRYMLSDLEKIYIKKFGKIKVTHQVFFLRGRKRMTPRNCEQNSVIASERSERGNLKDRHCEEAEGRRSNLL